MNKILFLSKLNRFFKIFFIIHVFIICFSNAALAEAGFWDTVFAADDFYDNKKFSQFLKDNYFNFFQDEFGVIEEEIRNEYPNASDEKIKKLTKEVIEQINQHFNERHKDLFENPAEEIRRRVLAKKPDATQKDVLDAIKKAEILTRLHVEMKEIKADYLAQIGIKTKPVKNPYLRFLPKFQKELKKIMKLDETKKSDSSKIKPASAQSDRPSSLKGFFEGVGLNDFFAYNPLEKSQKGRGFGEWLDLGAVKIRWLSTQIAFKEARPFLAALQFLITDDHYILPWRFGGDLGQPFSLNLSSSENIADDWEIKWLAPQRFIINQQNLFGYQSSVTIPILIKPQTDNQALTLKAQIDLELCHKECLNLQGELPPITINAGFYAPSNAKTLIENSLKDVTHTQSPYLIIREVYLDEDHHALIVKASSSRRKDHTDLFIESPQIKFLKPSIMIKNDELFFRVPFVPDSLPQNGLLGEKIKITVKNDLYWAEKEVIIKQLFNEQVFYPELTLGFLLTTFLIGIIFNLYPPLFVFNAESLALSETFGALNNLMLKKLFLSRASGIASFFMLLGLIGNLLKINNQTMVWSVWRNSNWSLWSALIISLFWFLERTAFFKTNDQMFLAFFKGLAGAFLGMVFSSYFIENKINFAFFYAGFWPSMLLFTLMTCGVMLPHFFWAFKLWSHYRFKMLADFKPLGNFVVLLSSLWFLMMIIMNAAASPAHDDPWLKYNPQIITKALDNNQIVLLKVISDSCLTCKINDFFVLESSILEKDLQRHKVIKMQADLADNSEDALKVLKKFGETQEPLYVFFSPDYPDGLMIKEAMGIDVIQRIISDLSAHAFKEEY